MPFSVLVPPREALRLFRTKKNRPSAAGMRSLSSVCDDPEPQVAHRALVCAASARHRMPTSSTNDAVCHTAACCCARTSTQALVCRLAQEHASHTTKIGNGISRKVHSDFFNPSTATFASLHHHLTTSARPSPDATLTGTARNMLRVRPRASGSTFSACVSAYSVEPEPLLWCTLVMTCLFCGPVLTRVKKQGRASRSAEILATI